LLHLLRLRLLLWLHQLLLLLLHFLRLHRLCCRIALLLLLRLIQLDLLFVIASFAASGCIDFVVASAAAAIAFDSAASAFASAAVAFDSAASALLLHHLLLPLWH
jgi:hypothetical protein